MTRDQCKWYWKGFDDAKAKLEQRSTNEHGEPVAHFGSAYVNENGVHITTVLGPVAIPQDAKLYTTPPPVPEAHKLKPLTIDQIASIAIDRSKPDGIIAFVRAIEAAHGIKE